MPLSSALVIFLLASPAAAAPAPCAEGQLNLKGNCCWPGQTWSKARLACSGAPTCPAGKRVEGESCVPDCVGGKQASPDTAGHCCWPQQAWSGLQQRCVGMPACQPGFKPVGDDCVVSCDPGKAVMADTAGHCCWPGQAWSSSRQQCVGIPSCPGGMVAEGEGCVSAPVPPPAPAPPPEPAPTIDESFLVPSVVDGGVPPVALVPEAKPAPVVAPPPGRPAPEATVALARPPAGVATRTHRPPWYLFGGLGVFALGYVPVLILPIFYKDYVPNANKAALIPLAGPLLVRNTLSDRNLYVAGWNAITIADALVQWVGAAGLVAGAIVWAVGSPVAAAPPDSVVVPAKDPVSDLKLWLTPAGAGASFAW